MFNDEFSGSLFVKEKASSSTAASAGCGSSTGKPASASPRVAGSNSSPVTAQVLSHQFIKTRMCPFAAKGTCRHGQLCTYAHNVQELRSPPDLFRTKMCEAWQRGGCTAGESCRYAHGREQLRATCSVYKTRICHFWAQGGCNKGDLCRHAHGFTELQQPALPSLTASNATSELTGARKTVATPSDVVAAPSGLFGNKRSTVRANSVTALSSTTKCSTPRLADDLFLLDHLRAAQSQTGLNGSGTFNVKNGGLNAAGGLGDNGADVVFSETTLQNFALALDAAASGPAGAGVHPASPSGSASDNASVIEELCQYDDAAVEDLLMKALARSALEDSCSSPGTSAIVPPAPVQGDQVVTIPLKTLEALLEFVGKISVEDSVQ